MKPMLGMIKANDLGNSSPKAYRRVFLSFAWFKRRIRRFADFYAEDFVRTDDDELAERESERCKVKNH